MTRISRKGKQRKGAIAVLAAVLLIGLVAMVAFAVDIGYIMVAQSDLQRAADAAAHAAVMEYRSGGNYDQKQTNARNTATNFVGSNRIINDAPTVDFNQDNEITGDIVLGRINMSSPRSPMSYDTPSSYNAVRVKVRRSAGKNGELPLMFARALGIDSIALEAEGTAAIVHNVGGFRIPSSGGNVPFLPITISTELWDAHLADSTDDYSWDPTTKTISEDSDGIPEVRLFPTKNGSSGNYGTVNVGISANSTDHLSKKIRFGLNQTDLDFHGGSLELDVFGELSLTGDPGISASLKDDLADIAGEPRVIPLYSEVTENGNNATYIITRFVGVRIMSVVLTGGTKYVSVQPADVSYNGVVQASTESASDRIYSSPYIVQ